MAVSVFDDKSVMPDKEMVVAALMGTSLLWEDLQNHIHETYPSITGEWKHYGKTAGWSFKLISNKRNLLFFVPLRGCFRIRIVLGEKAVACMETADLPDEVKESYRNATSYAEGRSVDIDISREEQLEVIKTLLKIKFEN
ncbi:MAG: DUF3788 domain-containing protein [Defluviitaleaceae bacterium]|nr:DUF3788 domain-containing protein [Defluviitaleaceae bacterium]